MFHPNPKVVAEHAHAMIARDHAGSVPTLDCACFFALERTYREEFRSHAWDFWHCVYDYLHAMRTGRVGP